MDSSFVTGDRVLRLVPRKVAFYLIAGLLFLASGVGGVLSGQWSAWLFIVFGGIAVGWWFFLITRRPQLVLTDSSLTVAAPIGRALTYDLRRCGEFRVWSVFKLPPKSVTFHNADTRIWLRKSDGVKWRFFSENRVIHSIFDLSAKDLAKLLNE